MKNEDYNEVLDVALALFDKEEYYASEVLPREPLCNALASIYMNADMNKAQTYHLTDSVALIVSERTLSIIDDDKSSHYRCSVPLIGYENLTEDLQCLFVTIDAVLYRIQANNE